MIVVLLGLALAAGALLWWQGQAPDSGLTWDRPALSGEGSAGPGEEPAAPGDGRTGSPPAGTGPAEDIVVHVAGAVARPGVYSLPAASRMVDAVKAAGGVTASADPNAINLARLIADGERLYVPTRAEVQNTGPAWSGASAWEPRPKAGVGWKDTGDSGSEAGPGGMVNLNTATEVDLDTLPGIGPTLAARIIQYRGQNGPFNSPEELMNVSGIGPKKYAELADLITVR